MIGKKLSDITTKRLIVLILILIFSIPILDRSTYEDPDPTYNFSLQLLSNVPYPSESYKFMFDDVASQFSNVLILVSYNLTYKINNFDVANYRPTEYVIVNPTNIEPAGLFSIQDDQ